MCSFILRVIILSLSTLIIPISHASSLYVGGTNSTEINVYDPVSGALINSFSNGGYLTDALAFGPTGNLFVGGSNGTGINVYDPVSGTLINSFSNGGYLTQGLAFSPVPIPPAIWLFGSGLIGLVGVARRKKA